MREYQMGTGSIVYLDIGFYGDNANGGKEAQVLLRLLEDHGEIDHNE
jgi:hypothetical protein